MRIATSFPKVPKVSPPFNIPDGATKMTTPTACGKHYYYLPDGGIFDAELSGDILRGSGKTTIGGRVYHVLPNGEFYNPKLEAELIACRDAPVPPDIIAGAAKIGMYGPGEIVYVIQDGEDFFKDGEVYHPGPEDQLVVIKDGEVFTPGREIFFILKTGEVYPVALAAQLAIRRATWWHQFSEADRQALLKLMAAMHNREEFSDLELDWETIDYDPDRYHPGPYFDPTYPNSLEAWSKWAGSDHGANGRLVEQVTVCTAWLANYMQKTRNPPPTLSVQFIRSAIEKEKGVLVAWNVPLFAADKLKLPVIDPETRNYQIVLQPERFGGPPVDEDGRDGARH
jgi:hypothetical protein